MIMKVIKNRPGGSRVSGVGEAKAHFSRLLRDVARGHEWVITERGQPVARLSPIEHRSLEDRLRLLEQAGVIERSVQHRPLPPPLPLESGLAHLFLDEDRRQ